MEETKIDNTLIEDEYNNLVHYLESEYNAVAGQMFGKKCIKVNNKAAVSLFKEYIVFKLPKDDVTQTLALSNSKLWDPSGKGRAMKEWVQLTIEHKSRFKELSIKAAEYVG
jgi:hypothetical protein